MNDSTLYKTSPAAMAERRRLLGLLKGMASLAVTLAALLLSPGSFPVWILSAALLLVIWRVDLSRWLKPYADRELLLQPHAIEEHRSGFTRLVLFEQLEQLRVRRDKHERVLAIELHTAQGACIIRGYENMESLFGYLSRQKPENVLIEIEEAGVDWQSPTPWAVVVLCAGATVLVLMLVFGS